MARWQKTGTRWQKTGTRWQKTGTGWPLPVCHVTQLGQETVMTVQKYKLYSLLYLFIRSAKGGQVVGCTRQRWQNSSVVECLPKD